MAISCAACNAVLGLGHLPPNYSKSSDGKIVLKYSPLDLDHINYWVRPGCHLCLLFCSTIFENPEHVKERGRIWPESNAWRVAPDSFIKYQVQIPSPDLAYLN
jgi:hypothetical protein